MTNSNAYAGMNNEEVFKTSISDHPEVIEAIRKKFKIDGEFITVVNSGTRGGKADAMLEFAPGSLIDVNIKSYKKTAGFNQLTRASASRFSEVFGLPDSDKDELITLITRKATNKKGWLFPPDTQKKWHAFFNDNAKKLIKWGFSSRSSREILALFERESNLIRIYPMQTILDKLAKNISFSVRGNVDIGNCISFQRKGGDGNYTGPASKTDIKHPGNDVQLKLKMNVFVKEMEPFKIAEYTV